MPLTGIFLLPPTFSADAIIARLNDAFPTSTPLRPFSLKHSLHRSTTDTPSQPPSSVLQTLTTSTHPDLTIIHIVSSTTNSTGKRSSSIMVPTATSSGISAFSQLLGSKMSAIWTPVRQYDLIVPPSSTTSSTVMATLSNSGISGAVESGIGGGGRVYQAGIFEVCVAEIVSSGRGAGGQAAAALAGLGISGEARGTRGVAVAVRLIGAELEDGEDSAAAKSAQSNNESSMEEQEQEKAILRDFRLHLDLKTMGEGAASAAEAVAEEFWGNVGGWPGEAAIWCEVLRSRGLGGVVRKNEVGR